VSVCLSACMYHNLINHKYFAIKFSVHVACGRGSVLLCIRRCDAVCTSGAVTIAVSTHNGQAKRCESGVYSKQLNRGQHGFDTAANTQSNPPGAALDRGWSLISTLALLQTAGGETRSLRECACAAVEYDVLPARSHSHQFDTSISAPERSRPTTAAPSPLAQMQDICPLPSPATRPWKSSLAYP